HMHRALHRRIASAPGECGSGAVPGADTRPSHVSNFHLNHETVRPARQGVFTQRRHAMPEVVFSVDHDRSMRDQAVPGHNRWHPDIPSAATIKPENLVRIESKEWTDGQIGNNDSANDVRDVALDHNHMLSGPFDIEGAAPGDLLVVDVVDLGPATQTKGDNCGEGWGYSGIFAKVNGGGFLTDYFPEAYKAVWDFRGQECTSRHIPGVRYTGIQHPG